MENKANKTEKEQIIDFLFLILRKWYYFVVSFAICGGIGLIYYKTATPVMRVEAKVGLRHDESLFGGPVSKSQSLMGAFGLGRGSENIEDESIKLASQGNIKNVIKSLELNKVYIQKEFLGLIKTDLYDQSPVILSVNPYMADTISKLITFTLNIKPEKTKIKIKVGKETLGKYEITSYPATLETSWGNFTFEKSTYYDQYEFPLNLKIVYSGLDYMAQIYREIIEVDFEKKTSDLINMGIKSKNTFQAKRILNEMIDSYNKEWVNDKELVSGKTLNFIDSRLMLTRELLAEADKQIQQFKNKYNLTEIEADVTYYLKLSAELQAHLLEAETQLSIVDIIVDFVQDEKNKYSLIPFNLPVSDESVSTVLEKYNDALIKRNELHKSNSLSAIARSLDEQVELQRKNLLLSLENVKKASQITLSNIKKKEKEFNAKIGNIPAIEKDYVHLRREQEIQQSIYVFLLEMREETGVKSVNLLPKLKIIDSPYIINKPVSPNLLKIAVVTLILGGGFPLSVIYGAPYLKNIKRRRKEK
jgi:uncharacterized protein involved in exopolysaccharide biosynthesis